MGHAALQRVLVTAAVFVALAATAGAALADEQERQIGEQAYQQIKASGLILEGTRYNRIVDEIGPRIARAAQGLYDEPFRFFVIHKSPPNAFAVPGGYMFIHDSLIDLVDTKDELACVAAHEISHVIHRDGMNRMRRNQRNNTLLAVGSIILGRSGQAVNTLGSSYLALSSLHFDRGQESAADVTGSDICSNAGYNPYGLVWMMEKFEKISAGPKTAGSLQSMEMFSNHPREDHRIADLENHFAQNPSGFERFAHDVAHGTPISASATAGDTEVTCPAGESSTRSARDVLAWLSGASDSLTGPVGTSAPLQVTDAISVPPAVAWIAVGSADASAVVAFDPVAKLAAGCIRQGSRTTFEVRAQPVAPTFLIDRSDLAAAKTAKGIHIGSTLASLFAAYGRTGAAPLPDGSSLYAYRRTVEGGFTATMRFIMKNGRVVAFSRETGF